MAEIEQHQTINDSFGKMNLSFSIWPPTQRTRDAVVNRLIETLSATSILSKRYGTFPRDTASAAAHRIEDEAFTAASTAGASDDGVEILQVYSKEIANRMLELVKSRSKADAASQSSYSDVAPATTVTAAAASEEHSSVETES